MNEDVTTTEGATKTANRSDQVERVAIAPPAERGDARPSIAIDQTTEAQVLAMISEGCPNLYPY